MRRLVHLLIEHPRIAALSAAFLLSFSGILYRLSETSPETASFFRSLYGLPILLVAAWFERRELGPLPRRSIYLSAVAGVLFAVDLVFWHHAVNAVGAGLATVLGNLQVVIVGVGAWLFFGERPSARTLAALPLVLGGIVLISGVLTANSYGADPQLGVGLGVVAAFAYAAYLMLTRHVGRRRAGEPVAVSTAATMVVSLAAGMAVGSLDLTPPLSAHLWLLILGVTAQAVGYLLISISLPRLPAVVVSILLLAQPVLAVIFSMLLLSETPSLGQLLGVALLLGGIAMATLRVTRRRAQTVGDVAPIERPAA